MIRTSFPLTPKNKALSALAEAIAVLVFIIWALNFAELQDSLRFLTFQTRDIDRARELLAGHWIYYGPETTGGGHLPGPFYYLLLASGLFFENSWHAAFKILFFLDVGAAFLGWLYFKRISQAAGFLWLALFLLSEAQLRGVGNFLNPSYLIPFSVFILVCFCTAFESPSPRRRSLAFVAGCLLLALGLQLHYSALGFGIAVVISQILARTVSRFRKLALPGKTLLYGGLAFIVPLLPYLLWSMFGENDLSAYPVQLNGTIFQALASISKFFILPAGLQLILGLYYLVLSVPLLLLALWMAAFFNTFSVPRPDKTSLEDDSLELQFLWVAFTCTFPTAAYLIFAPIAYRYGFPFSIIGIFLTTALFARLKPGRRLGVFLLLLVIVIVGQLLWRIKWEGVNDDLIWLTDSRNWKVALALAVAVMIFKTSWQVRLAGVLSVLQVFLQNPSMSDDATLNRIRLTPTVRAWNAAMHEICDATGWAPDEIMRRVYFVDAHMELDPWPILSEPGFRCVKSGLAKPPDGYIISVYTMPEGYSFADWITKQNIAEEVKRGIKDGAIRLGESHQYWTLEMAPYSIEPSAPITNTIHNIGLGYRRSPWKGEWPKEFRFPGVQTLSSNRFLFGWNECPSHHSYCDTGVLLTVAKAAQKTSLEVEVIGDSLAQSSPWIVPDWTESWQAPFLEASCGAQKFRVEIAKVIGYDRKYAFNVYGYPFFLSNHALLAPLHRSFQFGCDVSEIRIGRESSKVETLSGIRRFTAQELSLKL